jgi:hypothetical protein
MYETKLRATSLAAVLSVLVLAAAPAAQAADGVGLRIVRDPVSGQLRAPTPEEAQAMDAQEAKARAAKAAAAAGTAKEAPAPMEFRQANGSVRYRVGDAFLSYSVVTRKADGSLDMQCVAGKDAAEKAVLDPKAAALSTPATLDQEHDHAHQ